MYFEQGDAAYKGFRLTERLVIESKIAVLTGRNGGGKTRFLTAVADRSSIRAFSNGGDRLLKESIQLVATQGLTPGLRLTPGNDKNALRDSSLIAYKKNIRMFKNYHEESRGYEGDGAIGYSALFYFVDQLASRLGKDRTEISDYEFQLYFSSIMGSPALGQQRVGDIFNEYLQRKEQNVYFKYLREASDPPGVTFIPLDQYEAVFGPPPWIPLNAALAQTFGGRYSFSLPDEASRTYNSTIHLLDFGQPTDVANLSSGEKALLWLALALFNAQYKEGIVPQSPKLLLLDEPDAFLHPQMVARMYQTFSAFVEAFDMQVILSTHSPTTAALAPESSIYLVEDHGSVFRPVSKDEAISNLLSGVTQISVEHDNRRQIYVESHYDADTYQDMADALKRHPGTLDPSISLLFVSSGAKMPEGQLRSLAEKHFTAAGPSDIQGFIKALNGVGNCNEVYGAVEALLARGNRTVRGLADWDTKNTSTAAVKVLDEGRSYGKENVLLDPFCTAFFLVQQFGARYSPEEVSGTKLPLADWLTSAEVRQGATDWWINRILGSSNARDVEIRYFDGGFVRADSRYLKFPCHPLQERIIDEFIDLRSIIRSGTADILTQRVVRDIMIRYSGGRLIPAVFVEAMRLLQQPL
jgi:predicted ATPase